MRGRRPPAVRLYRLLVGLLPPDIREYREDMEAAFAAQWAEARGAGRRLRLALRTLGRLPAVLAMEWLEYLGARAAPGRTTTTMGGGTNMLGDLKHATRSLRKAPAFTLSVVVLIAMGVGAVTTIFTLVDQVLLRPLPYPQGERLVFVDHGSHSGPFFQRLEELDPVEAWAGAWESQVSLRVGEEPRQVPLAQVTDGFFELFGAHAVRGRLLEEDDFTRADAVVVSATAWRTLWGGDPGLVGRTLQVDGRPHVVVGILDGGFQPPGPLVGSEVTLWRPVDWSVRELASTDFHVLQVAGRMAPGASVDQVQAGVDRLVASMAETDANFVTRAGELTELPVLTLSEATVRGVRTGLGLLLAAVGVLLLVACVNVAHLFLARGLGRAREMAVRRAMGAGTLGVARHLLAESLVVGAAGGLLGAGLAALGLRVFLALSPTVLPRGSAVSVDLRVLLFAMAVAGLTAVLFGMVPALRSVGRDLADSLHAGGRTATGGRGVTGLRNLLVSGEVALSLVLVASAGLLLRSFVAVRTQETGFRVEDVWTVPLSPTEVATVPEYLTLMDEIVRATEAVPGVQAATYGLTMPMQHTGGSRCCWGTSSFVAEGVTLEGSRINMHPVTPTYFSVLELPVLAGRGWTEAETRGDPLPVVLSEPLAIEAFGSAGAAVGRSLEAAGGPATVVGVVADNRHYGLEQEHGAAIYLPMERVPFPRPIPRGHVAVRLAPGAEAGIAGALRRAVWSVAPSMPVPVVRSMEGWIARSTAERRFQSAIFGAFATVALLLAAGGLYGTLLFTAGQRRRELGIRLALGATRGRIEARLLRSGLLLTGAGVVVGLAGAWFTSRFLESRIWGVERGDPVTLAAAAALLLVTAALASWIPARRAGRTDPLEALRAE